MYLRDPGVHHTGWPAFRGLGAAFRGLGPVLRKCFCFLNRGPGPSNGAGDGHLPRDQKTSAMRLGPGGTIGPSVRI